MQYFCSSFDPTAMSSYLFIVKTELPNIILGLNGLPDDSQWVCHYNSCCPCSFFRFSVLWKWHLCVFLAVSGLLMENTSSLSLASLSFFPWHYWNDSVRSHPFIHLCVYSLIHIFIYPDHLSTCSGEFGVNHGGFLKCFQSILFKLFILLLTFFGRALLVLILYLR